jgi:glutathione S-transferase
MTSTASQVCEVDMKIHGDVISPFVRMCLVTAHEVGLKDRVSLASAHAKPTEVNAALEKLNPVGKIPVLETDHHHAVYDSRVIMEYLAHVGGSRSFIPDDGVKRFRVLTLQALAQGMGDAAVALRYELAQRPEEKQWPDWIERTKQRVRAGVDDVETNWQDALGDAHAGTVALACVLAYVDLRHPTMHWRAGHAKTAAWFDSFVKRPSMTAWPLPS